MFFNVCYSHIDVFYNYDNFYRAMLCMMRTTMLSQDVSQCVCPSVCPSHVGVVSKELNISSTFSSFCSHTIPVFPH